SADGVTYTYDGDGNRVMKSNGTIYWYGANSASLEESDLSGNLQRWYYFFDGQRVGRSLTTNEVGFYMTDALGSVRYLGGSATGYRFDYFPFGAPILDSDTGDDRYQFTGKERDSESGLDDFDARYYSSSMGRFMSPDWSESPEAVPYGVLSNPQTLNLYAYVKNNPLKDTDPTGHSGDDDIVDHILNFAVSAATTFLSDNVFGAFRPTPKSPEGTFGQAVGDFAAQQSGIAEAEAGSAGLTDAGVMAVIPGGQEAAAGDAVVSGAAVLHGTATAAIATANLAKDANQTSSGGPKANDAPGVTAAGQATDKQGNKLGPSGKPQINETNSNTREGAGNRALNEGSGKVEHPNPKRGEPHFHPTDNKGKKKPGSTHHNYPD
ncbi:MAG: RHS repeat-associated core domain-containing protein, partial [Candidatus Acidiferrum sp.]